MKRVVIGTHGICGINADFEGLATFLVARDPHTALYAYNTRTQGLDPVESRRGDICSAEEWYRDLKRFSDLVQKQHPTAEIIWSGESMGTMISLNSFAYWRQKGIHPCQRLILSAPVINLRGQLKPWQEAALNIAVRFLPLFRISLNTLSGGQSQEITQGLNHNDEAAQNPYAVESFTLRFLHCFNKEVDKMSDSISKVDIPLAVFHGGNDFFSKKNNIEAFLQQSPDQTQTRFFHYPDAYHLMLYDDHREKIFTDILDWLHKTPT